MKIDDSVIETELQKMMNDIIYWFNAGKLDWIVQIKNIAAVVVRSWPPSAPPPQTGRIWVDTLNARSYMSTGTSAVTDWSILWVLGWSIGNTYLAVGNSSGNLVSYSTLNFVNATWILNCPIVDADTEFRVWHQKVVTSRQTAAYTWNSQWSAYTGIDNLQAWTPYAQLTDINALRVAYEALRSGYENLRTALQTHGLIS